MRSLGRLSVLVKLERVIGKGWIVGRVEAFDGVAEARFGVGPFAEGPVLERYLDGHRGAVPVGDAEVVDVDVDDVELLFQLPDAVIHDFRERDNVMKLDHEAGYAGVVIREPGEDAVFPALDVHFYEDRFVPGNPREYLPEIGASGACPYLFGIVFFPAGEKSPVLEREGYFRHVERLESPGPGFRMEVCGFKELIEADSMVVAVDGASRHPVKSLLECPVVLDAEPDEDSCPADGRFRYDVPAVVLCAEPYKVAAVSRLPCEREARCAAAFRGVFFRDG